MKQSRGNILFVVSGYLLFGALNFTVLRSSEEDVVINHDAYADANQLIQYGRACIGGCLFTDKSRLYIETIELRPTTF